MFISSTENDPPSFSGSIMQFSDAQFRDVEAQYSYEGADILRKSEARPCGDEHDRAFSIIIAYELSYCFNVRNIKILVLRDIPEM